MQTVLVTGADGFLGKNLCLALSRRDKTQVLRYDVGNSPVELEALVGKADFIFHFAGVNRPKDTTEFAAGNTELTKTLGLLIEKQGRKTPVLISSSTQAELDNPYGSSKLRAEKALTEIANRAGFPVLIYRFPNLFGKWSRPNYNSVVSTFCYNAANGIPLQVNDPDRSVTFAYVDDVIEACLQQLERMASLQAGAQHYAIEETYTVTLGELAELVQSFAAIRTTSILPDLQNPFARKLYSTFLSYYPTQDLAYPVDMKTDNRGWLFEFLKSPHFGQIFISKTLPGIIRGDHGHDTKVEKFCVIQGQGTIRFRHLMTQEISEHQVSDAQIMIVDIPPGYTHSIENTGDTEMITLFWANEIFDPQRPDTYYEPVIRDAGEAER